MTEARIVAKNTMFVALGDIVAKVLTLVIAIFLARMLGSERYGIFVFAYAFPTFILLLADWGLQPVLILNLSRNKTVAGKYLTSAFILRSLLSIIAYVLMSFLAFLFGFPEQTLSVILIIGAASTVLNVALIFPSIFIAFERTEYFALVKIIERVFTTAIVLVLLSSGFGLMPVSLAILSGSLLFLLVSCLIAVTRFARFERAPTLRNLGRLIKEGFPFMLSAVFTSVFFSVVIILLTFLGGSSATGYFNAAFSLVISATVLPGYLGPAIFPVMSKHSQNSRDYVRKVLHKSQKYFFIIGLPIAIGGFILAEPIITAVYGEGFSPSIIVLQILVWDIAITFFLTGMKDCLASFNFIRLHMISVGSGAIMNLALCLLLIPSFSYVGACYAFLLSRLIMVSLLLYFAMTRIGPLGIRRLIPKPVIAGGLMAMVLWWLQGIHFLILIAIGLAVYFTILILIRTFDEDDKSILGNAILGKWNKKTV